MSLPVILAPSFRGRSTQSLLMAKKRGRLVNFKRFFVVVVVVNFVHFKEVCSWPTKKKPFNDEYLGKKKKKKMSHHFWKDKPWLYASCCRSSRRRLCDTLLRHDPNTLHKPGPHQPSIRKQKKKKGAYKHLAARVPILGEVSLMQRWTLMRQRCNASIQVP